MKIRIEGCTAEALAEHSDYLTLGKVYEAQLNSNGHWTTRCDEGLKISIRVNPKTFKEMGCAHLPTGAKWVVVEGTE